MLHPCKNAHIFKLGAPPISVDVTAWFVAAAARNRIGISDYRYRFARIFDRHIACPEIAVVGRPLGGGELQIMVVFASRIGLRALVYNDNGFVSSENIDPVIEPEQVQPFVLCKTRYNVGILCFTRGKWFSWLPGRKTLKYVAKSPVRYSFIQYYDEYALYAERTGVRRVDGATKKSSIIYSGEPIRRVSRNHHGTVFVTWGQELCIVSPDGYKVERYKLPAIPTCAVKISSDRVAVGLGNGKIAIGPPDNLEWRDTGSIVTCMAAFKNILVIGFANGDVLRLIGDGVNDYQFEAKG